LKFVYILKSDTDIDHFYVGVTDDVAARLQKHNAGEVSHTSKYRPWHLKTYVAFSDEKRAFEFEKYLKSGSGRAFAKIKALKAPGEAGQPGNTRTAKFPSGIPPG